MYVEMFDSIPWAEVGISVLQTLVLYWVVLLGLKLAGRRVFSEVGAQDLVVLMLVAEASNLGLVHEDAGFWGAAFSVIAILAMGAVIERVPPLRRALGGKAVILYRDGIVDRKTMKAFLVDEDELHEAAREYGLQAYTEFSVITLEGNGKLSGILKVPFNTGRVAQEHGV